MEVKVYRVYLEIDCIEPGDYLSIGEWQERFEDTYATKRAAIRVCQSKFAKQPLNDYVIAARAYVRRITITDMGVTEAKRIYNKYKSI